MDLPRLPQGKGGFLHRVPLAKIVFMQHAVGATFLLLISSFYFLFQLEGLTKGKLLGKYGKSKKQIGHHWASS